MYGIWVATASKRKVKDKMDKTMLLNTANTTDTVQMSIQMDGIAEVEEEEFEAAGDRLSVENVEMAGGSGSATRNSAPGLPSAAEAPASNAKNQQAALTQKHAEVASV